MSTNLKKRIRKSIDTNYVWIDCAGRFPADRLTYRLYIYLFIAFLNISIKIFKNKSLTLKKGNWTITYFPSLNLIMYV